MPDNKRPTQVKDRVADPWSEFGELDDLIGYRPNLPAAAKKSDVSQTQPQQQPLGKASIAGVSGERTRARLSGMSASDQMRSNMERLRDLEDQDEISDQEAAGRAGLASAEGDDPQPQQMPVVRVDRETLPAVISTAVAVPEIEWHQVRNLPGYLKNAIRAMGRKEMAKRTNTPLEDIVTIAYLQPSGQRTADTESRPNTQAELVLVANYLRQHAQALGAPSTGHGPDIPGYRAEVREYLLQGIRFHVVRDFIDDNLVGHYIYAWPESDSKKEPGSRDLGQLANDRRPQLSGERKKLPKR